MAAFKDLKTPAEIKGYLLSVLSRTGNKNKDGVFLYHYTSIQSLSSIISSGFIWLGSTQKMNDYLEGEFINSTEGSNRIFFSCFSRAEENLAMYKMYAPSPGGAMMAVPFSLAQDMIEGLPDSKEGNKLVRIVRDNTVTDETVPAHVYWAAVAYKDLHTDLLKAETVVNIQIKNPLNVQELAGFVKLYGWEYEKEVRLVATTLQPLAENEKIALPLPEGFANRIQIIMGPEFDKKANKALIAKLKRIGVTLHDSEYDALVDLGMSLSDDHTKRIAELEQENAKLKQRIEELEEKEDFDEEAFDEAFDWPIDGYHERKNSRGDIIEKGTFKTGKLIDGIAFNIVLRIETRREEPEYLIEDLDKDDEYVQERQQFAPVKPEEIKNENWSYNECGRYERDFFDMICHDYVEKLGIDYFYVVDKMVRVEGRELQPTFTNFRTLDSMLEKDDPDSLEYLRTGKMKYDEADHAEIDLG